MVIFVLSFVVLFFFETVPFDNLQQNLTGNIS